MDVPRFGLAAMPKSVLTPAIEARFGCAHKRVVSSRPNKCTATFRAKVRGSEKRVKIEGLGQPPNLAGVEDDRSSSSVDAEVAGVHVGLGEDQRLVGNADISDGWVPLAELRNSLVRQEKEKLWVSRGKQTYSGGQTLLK